MTPARPRQARPRSSSSPSSRCSPPSRSRRSAVLAAQGAGEHAGQAAEAGAVALLQDRDPREAARRRPARGQSRPHPAPRPSDHGSRPPARAPPRAAARGGRHRRRRPGAHAMSARPHASPSVLDRAADYFLTPVPEPARPALAATIPSCATRAAVLGPPSTAPPLAAALAGALCGAERRSTAVVAIWSPEQAGSDSIPATRPSSTEAATRPSSAEAARGPHQRKPRRGPHQRIPPPGAHHQRRPRSRRAGSPCVWRCAASQPRRGAGSRG